MPDDLLARLREAAVPNYGITEDAHGLSCSGPVFSPEAVQRGLERGFTAALKILDPGPIPDLGMRATARAAMLDAFIAGASDA